MMADKKPKATRRSIRKQRWAAIIAVIISVGMLASLAFSYFDWGAARDKPPDQWSLDDYLEYYRGNIETLERYLEEHEPTVAVLESLAESYNSVIMLQQLFSGDGEDVPALREKLVGVYKGLAELAPAELLYRIELLHAYRNANAEEDTILEEADRLAELLRETPKATVHLQLINFLASMEAGPMLEEEISWLEAYLLERIEEDEADNIDRYVLAILSAEYLEDREAAFALLDGIMEAEEEGSSIYNEVKQYRDKLTAMEETGDGED